MGLNLYLPGNDFISSTDTFGGAPFHKALEIRGTVFAGEVAIARRLCFRAGK